MLQQPVAYIMTNHYKGTIYTGVTRNLVQRVYQHRCGQIVGFTKRYGCKRLVYYEVCPTMLSAIAREKQIKSMLRKDKLALIEKNNSMWLDLYESLI